MLNDHQFSVKKKKRRKIDQQNVSSHVCVLGGVSILPLSHSTVFQ